MKTLLTLLIFFPTFAFGQLFGEREVGVIKDIDGFTLIRINNNKKSEIVDTLFKGEFFQYIKNDTSDWCKVYKMWNSSGYVHKNRIQDLKSLKIENQYNLINSIFDKELIWYKEWTNKTINEKSKNLHHHEKEFVPILDLFINYMCKSYDDSLMRKFFDIMIIEEGSADEMPPTALGYIYKCQPKLIDEMLKEYDNKVITDNLEFGKINIGIEE